MNLIAILKEYNYIVCCWCEQKFMTEPRKKYDIARIAVLQYGCVLNFVIIYHLQSFQWNMWAIVCYLLYRSQE